MKTFLITILLMSSDASRAEYFTQLATNQSIQFIHNNGQSDQFYYPEIVGSGVAVIDYDNDGDLDLYLIQSGPIKDNKLSDQMHENIFSETNSLAFNNATKKLNLNNSLYGIGIATSDINHDGWTDIYLTNAHTNQLLINNKGNGFVVGTQKNSEALFSSSASFCDVNNDGFDDLYVVNYVNWSVDNNPKCYNSSSKRDFCGPGSFKGLRDRFFLNDNGNNLNDKTKQFFPKMPAMPGLNVVCRDVNNDGWNDFIIANDGAENLLWLNQAGHSFKQVGLFSGLAVNDQGVAEASMGMAVGDYDIDGDFDVFFTHLMNETNTLYKNNGKGYFQDVTNRSKLSTNSFSYTGWATQFVLVNDDIYPDLVVFNGAVADDSDQSTQMSSLKQSNQLYLNSKTQKFTAVTDEKWLQQKHISRGAAFGDLDNDGDQDIIINNNNDSAQIFINNLNPKVWSGIKFNYSGNQVLKIKLVNKQQEYLINHHTDGGYASAHDPRIIINQAQIEHFDTLNFVAGFKTIKTMPLSSLPKNQYSTINLQ